jgi:hypothetical protein
MEGMTAQHDRDDARIDAASTLFDALMRAQPSGAAPKRRPEPGRSKTTRAQKRSA